MTAHKILVIPADEAAVFDEAIKTLGRIMQEASSVMIPDERDEENPGPGRQSRGPRRDPDTKCPECGQMCRGSVGLATHTRLAHEPSAAVTAEPDTAID